MWQLQGNKKTTKTISMWEHLACGEHIRDGFTTHVGSHNDVLLLETVSSTHSLASGQSDGFGASHQLLRGCLCLGGFIWIKSLWTQNWPLLIWMFSLYKIQYAKLFLNVKILVCQRIWMRFKFDQETMLCESKLQNPKLRQATEFGYYSL